MKANLTGLLFGSAFGFLMAWAGLADPAVIRDMLLLRHFDVFLLMGSAIAVAALGQALLRRLRARAAITGEPIEWKGESPERRHIVGSALFGAGWSIAGTCPGPVAAMVGEGRVAGLFVALGLVGGALAQGALSRRRSAAAITATETPGTVGL